MPGADVNYQEEAWGGSATPVRPGAAAGLFFTYVKQVEVTVAFTSGAGGVTATVTNTTRGETIPFSPYVEEGWGFVAPGIDQFDVLRLPAASGARYRATA